MWQKEYRDYKTDKALKKQTVSPGKGIIGCEMHEINGWGNTLQHPRKRKKGLIGTLITQIFGSKKKEES